MKPVLAICHSQFGDSEHVCRGLPGLSDGHTGALTISAILLGTMQLGRDKETKTVFGVGAVSARHQSEHPVFSLLMVWLLSQLGMLPPSLCCCCRTLRNFSSSLCFHNSREDIIKQKIIANYGGTAKKKRAKILVYELLNNNFIIKGIRGD